jgi:DNA adenine methylase
MEEMHPEPTAIGFSGPARVVDADPATEQASRETSVGSRDRARPVTKTAGGKTRLLPQLLARVPRTYGTYHEPFCGGAALYLALQPDRAFLADANSALIATYEEIRRAPDEVAVLCRSHEILHTSDYYYHTRVLWNRNATPDGRLATGPEMAAMFLYLNHTCYNGLWRVNRDGEFNVPFGRYVNPKVGDLENLRRFARVLDGVTLRAGDFRATTADVQAGDFAYFDPPYHPRTKTASFTAYTVGGFGLAEQKALEMYSRHLVERGAMVMLSNSDTPFVRRLYRDRKVWRVDRVTCDRAINSKGGKRGHVKELIIMGGY